MNGYHDRSADDPRPPAEDRPVAGWPGHDADRPADEHTEEPADEHTGEAPAEDEPLTGEVVDEEPAGEYETGTGWGGRHERAEEPGDETAGEGEHTGRGHLGEPFGTEEPMVVTEPAESEATAETTDETAATTEPEAVTPVAATEPAAEPVAEGARPTEANELTVDRLLEQEAAERLHARWRDIKAVFVDDPADAVRQAGTLTGEAVEELTATLGRLHQELDGAWDGDRETDTERLRVALRGYGSLIERILTR